MDSIDRSDATPLYHQIYLGLRDEILAGRRAEGAAMPTEQALAKAYDVSRITARRALAELSVSGLVERRRRTGTRVIFRSPITPIEAGIERAVDALLTFGRTTAVHVIDIVENGAAPDVARLLDVSEGTPVLHARRLRSLDGEPLGLVSSWMPVDIAAKLAQDAFATTPMLALLQDAGIAIGSANQTVGAELADAALADRLGLPPRAAVLWIERVVRDPAGRAVLFTRAQYRADRYRLTLELSDGGAQPSTFA